MNTHKPFFAFLILLVLLCAGVGFYAYRIDSCAANAAVFPVMECYKLYMAFGVLFAVAVILALGAGFYALVPPHSQGDHPGKAIFDTLSKTLLPVVTLVLGYYFGSAQVTAPQRPSNTDAPNQAAAASSPKP
jgi:ABC-type dipeptide/oligopeptide/nickel transport system permease component